MTRSKEPSPSGTARLHDVGHIDHAVDRDLIGYALDRLDESRSVRRDPVPKTPELDLPIALPESGIDPRAALERLGSVALDSSAQLHHPGYFAHMDPPTPAVAWAAALWQVATNQNLLHPDVAPAARSLSDRVVDWLAPFFGMNGGHFVPGSTVANLTALWAATDLRGVRRVVASERSHLSLRKAAHLLGLEYVAVPTDASHHLAVDALPSLDDAVLVLTAGTVATGAIDPLRRPSDAAWVHVDAAWAAPLRLSETYAGLLDGIEQADSVSCSAHKWLYQPKGAALVFFKDSASAHEAMSYGGGYLAVPNVGVVGSAPVAALPLAATLLAFGRAGIAERLESDMGKAQQLVKLIDADSRLERFGPMETGVVVWRPREQDPRVVRDRLEDAWVSLTVIDEQVWFRSVAANPAADADHVVAQVLKAL